MCVAEIIYQDTGMNPSKKSTNVKSEHTAFHPKKLLREVKEETSLILLLVPIVLTLWVYFGKQANAASFFPALETRWNLDFYSTMYEYVAAFVLMFCVPVLFVVAVFKKGLSDYGFRLGDTRYGFRFLAVGIPVVFLVAYLGAGSPQMQAEYPLAKSAMGHVNLFFIIEIFYLIYYVGWEFLFRGFMLFGLEKRFGALAAILIQTIPSAIVHIGKPASESFAAILAGIVFGYLAIRTRSILYPLILHAVVGLGTDVFVTLRIL